jgi:hypothetical protein
MNFLQNKGEVYKITSPCGKIYIGQTKCLVKRKDKYIIWGTQKRWKAHINEANSLKKEGCLKLNNYINKYKSDNFIVEVLLICDIKYLDYYESCMINKYNTIYPNGLNLKTGGANGIFSEETKLKMSNSAKGRIFSSETIEKIRQGNLGKIVSDETKEKLRIANTGKKLTYETKQKISNFQKDYLQPKRKHFGLPDYIYRINYSNKQGYTIKNHPSVPNKYFVSSSISMEEKLKLAIQYLQQV